LNVVIRTVRCAKPGATALTASAPASNRDLEEAVARGELREDLFYRINVIPIRLPPLRERREDIPLLVDFFLDKYAHELGVAPKRVSIEAMRALEAYHWPGNVRELENVIERTLTLAPGETMRRDDLPPQVLSSRRGGPGGVELPEEGIDLEAYLDEVRADLMRQALERSEGVQTRAAELLGTSFRSFRYYARKAGITGGEEEGDGAGEGGSPTRG
jgi:DNA-binding NtrC family response regulator